MWRNTRQLQNQHKKTVYRKLRGCCLTMVESEPNTHAQNHFKNLKTVGGALCLDFVNTVGARDTPTPTERLHTYEELTAWAERVAILSPEQGAQLRADAAHRATEAEETLRRALSLREALFRIFAAVAEGADADADDLALLNANIAASYSNLRLMSADGARFTWEWRQDASDLACVLWPIVWSAAELLTTGDLARVRMCQHEHCGWMFIDRSKNRSRRWCDMKECGNVEKVRRYRRKQKP